MGNQISTSLNEGREGENTKFFTGFPKVKSSSYETSTEKRDRTLKHLLRLNHQNFSVIYLSSSNVADDKKPSIYFHNHTVHALGSAYLVGASAEHLQALYDDETKSLAQWSDSPHEISTHDWEDYLGEPEYQRAYLDFFEDEMVRLGYDWRKVVAKYLLGGKNPLINRTFGGLGHPLIQIGYAFELNNREVAMEALATTATQYDFLHKYIDEFPSKNSSSCTLTPNELLFEIKTDPQFDGIFTHVSPFNIMKLLQVRETAVLEYCNKIAVPEPQDNKGLADMLGMLTKTAILLFCATSPHDYDFLICHLLTTSYALRVVLPELPSSFAPKLLRAHWMFIVIVYIALLRPAIFPALIENVDDEGKTWHDILTCKALNQRRIDGEMEDTHFLKAMRAMRDSAILWPEDDLFYRKAAVKFGWGFTSWFQHGQNGRAGG